MWKMLYSTWIIISEIGNISCPTILFEDFFFFFNGVHMYSEVLVFVNLREGLYGGYGFCGI